MLKTINPGVFVPRAGTPLATRECIDEKGRACFDVFYPGYVDPKNPEFSGDLFLGRFPSAEIAGWAADDLAAEAKRFDEEMK